MDFAVHAVDSPSAAERAGTADQGAMDKFARVQEDLSETTDLMRQNIEAVVDRGEHLELLVDKSDGLTANAAAFQKQSRGLRQALWWKNVKILLGIGTAGLFLLALIVLSVCGRDLSYCRVPAWLSP